MKKHKNSHGISFIFYFLFIFFSFFLIGPLESQTICVEALFTRGQVWKELWYMTEMNLKINLESTHLSSKSVLKIRPIIIWYFMTVQITFGVIFIRLKLIRQKEYC